jgi:hypothetical protein
MIILSDNVSSLIESALGLCSDWFATKSTECAAAIRCDASLDPQRLGLWAELAQTCYAVRRSELQVANKPLTDLFEALGNNFVAQPWLIPSMAFHFARYIDDLLLVIRALQAHDVAVDCHNFIQRQLDAGHTLSLERPPSRVILLRALLDEAGFIHSLPDYTQFYVFSLPAQRSSPVLVMPNEFIRVYDTALGLSIARSNPGGLVADRLWQELGEYLALLFRVVSRQADPDAVTLLMASCLLAEKPIDESLLVSSWNRIVESLKQTSLEETRSVTPDLRFRLYVTLCAVLLTENSRKQ